MNASALIVVYNKAIADIACLDELRKANVVTEIIVCDNSTEPNDNKIAASKQGITYVSMSGNVGLSRAYNAGIKRCSGDVVCVFDDDTQVIPGYFEELSRRFERDKDWDILLPIVFTDDGGIMSPVEFNGYRAKPIDGQEPSINYELISGINSGMVVKRRVFDTVIYDERLFLDYVDHRFCSDARMRGHVIAFDPEMVLVQSFSLMTDSAEQAAKRYEIFKKDAFEFYDNGLEEAIYCYVMLAYRKTKLVRKYGFSKVLLSGKAVGCNRNSHDF